jgi:4-hydroxy-2-oxoglutarate aldolase
MGGVDAVPESTLDLEGIFPPVPTPFGEEGQISVAQLRGNLGIWNRFPLRGYVALGSNGEAALLDREERLSVLVAIREGMPPDRLLIAGTGAQSTKETIALSRAAASVGADAVLVLPPSYYRSRMTRESLVKHYTAVAEEAGVPVLIYNMPGCTGIDLDAETIEAVASHPNVIGLKDSGGDIVKLGRLAGRLKTDFQILAGSAGFLLPALVVGAVGGVLALANIAPRECLEILEAYRKGELATAAEVQVRMIPANTAVTSGGGVPALKRALDLLGAYGGPVRAPLLDLTERETSVLGDTLRRAGIGSLTEEGRRGE